MPRVALALPLILVMLLVRAGTLQAQSTVTESPELRAKAAVARGDYITAIPILKEELSQRPSADIYLNLGIAYGLSKDWQKAQDTLQEGTERYPQDAGLSRELA